MIDWCKRRYGASPWHLIGHLVAIGVAAYALAQILDPRFSHPVNLVAWLIGGALLHDLVLLPLYTVLDIAGRAAVADHELRRVRIANHLRFPVVIAGTLFLVYFPLILGKSEANYVRDTGHEPPDYLGRWLAITGALFAVSAVIYAVRLIAARRREAPAPSPRPDP